jgi:beta-xylosidase
MQTTRLSIKSLFIVLFFVTNYSQIIIAQNTTVNDGFSPKWGDLGNGTFANPVIPGDYSDIDAIRVGSSYYAISSTFQYSPGVVILQSKDLVNWEIFGHVVKDLTVISPELNWDKMNRYGRGIWAGSLRYYKGKFWVYFGTPEEGFFMSSAVNPAGPWEPLHAVWRVAGWDDCCSFCDDDGQLYLVASNFALDPKTNKKYNIHLFKMTPDGKNLIMESDTIIHQSNGSEANKLYKINGVYYHYYSEVNKEGRVIMMNRSKNIYGPYETKQLNHVNKGYDRNPNQGGLMQTLAGDWWFFTHHGTGHWDGRVASLLPVTWVDGWPIIGKVGADKIGNMVWNAKKPINIKTDYKIQTNDEFNKPTLAVQWEWNYQDRSDKWSLTDKKGFMRLYAFRPINPTDKNKIILRAGNTLTQRSMGTAHNEITIKMSVAKMADGQYAGLTHFSSTSNSTFGIKQQDGVRKLVYHNNGNDSIGKQINVPDVYLKSTWNYAGVSTYSYSEDGKTFKLFGGTYQLSWGSYRGDRIGIFNYNVLEDKGIVDIDWFHYTVSK